MFDRVTQNLILLNLGSKMLEQFTRQGGGHKAQKAFVLDEVGNYARGVHKEQTGQQHYRSKGRGET